ncbi:hypothetical protein FH972_024186 [Carpinus fangiana]|uniref:Uncharacterized protein n=1 Tax=Carpinus fangiana TaxID=176857 RepID=A0A5N6KXB0_9ROSI|nr:hypothetical protein FH972_024186 [Carpinus fangiana]
MPPGILLVQVIALKGEVPSYRPTAVAPPDVFMLLCGAAAEGAGPSGIGTSSNSS